MPQQNFLDIYGFCRNIKFNMLHAVVAELADAPDLGSGVLDVGVQVPSAAPEKPTSQPCRFFRLISFCIYIS